MDKLEFGSIIRKARIAQDLSLRATAQKVGISPTYLSRIERGNFDPPSAKTIKIMSDLLGFDYHNLLNLAGKCPTCGK